MLLARFPGLAALVPIYGLGVNPAQVEKQVAALPDLVHGSAQKLIGDEPHQLVSLSGSALSIGVVVGLLISIWSLARLVSVALIAGLPAVVNGAGATSVAK